MVGGTGLPWALVHVGFGIPIREYSVPRGIASPDGRVVLVLGLLVMAGAACFTVLGSKRMRIGAGALVVLAAAAGLLIAFPADPSSFAGRSFPAEVPCHDSFLPGPCPLDLDAGGGLTLARFGAILAAGAGVVALLRSGGEALPSPPAGYGVPSGAGRTEGPTTPIAPPTSGAEVTGSTVVAFGTPHKRRMSDASLLGWILVALVMAFFLLAIVLTVIASIICSQPSEWC